MAPRGTDEFARIQRVTFGHPLVSCVKKANLWVTVE